MRSSHWKSEKVNTWEAKRKTRKPSQNLVQIWTGTFIFERIKPIRNSSLFALNSLCEDQWSGTRPFVVHLAGGIYYFQCNALIFLNNFSRFLKVPKGSSRRRLSKGSSGSVLSKDSLGEKNGERAEGSLRKWFPWWSWPVLLLGTVLTNFL